jgi:hypothetical protein
MSSSIASVPAHTTPRLRVFGKGAEFETERHLERFFLATVLPKLQLKLLASQYTCGQGICDILALGPSNQLIIIELKNTKDTHVVEQITRYFDALTVEKPFDTQVDYAQPIELYTVCPNYTDSLAMTMKYHRLNFSVLAYRIENEQHVHKFELWNWLTNEVIAHIEIPRTENTPDTITLLEPPKAFLKLLERCTDHEHSQAYLIRQQIYEFSQSHNYKICERPDGQWIRFERNKQYPIAELGWDGQRRELVINLWLPFTTINGRLNLRRDPTRYKRTSMMRIWLDNDEVKYLGYIHNSSRRWLIVTIQELKNERFPIPTKLNKWLKCTDDQYWISEGIYWKGLAMSFKTYTETMDLPSLEMSTQAVVQLALGHSLDGRTQQRNRKQAEAIPSH